MKKVFLALICLLLVTACVSCNNEAQKATEKETVANTEAEGKAFIDFEWKGEYTISELVSDINKASADPLVVPDKNSDGSFDENTPGDLIPVNELRRANPSLVGKKIKLNISGASDTIAVLYAAKDGSAEKTVIISGSVMIIAKTSFGTAKAFDAALDAPMDIEVLGCSIMSGEDYRRCKANKETLGAIKEENGELEIPALEEGKAEYSAYMSANGYEVYSRDTLEKIFADNDYEDNGLGVFTSTYERFGVKDIVNS